MKRLQKADGRKKRVIHSISVLLAPPLPAFYQRCSKLSIAIPLSGDAVCAIVLSASLALRASSWWHEPAGLCDNETCRGETLRHMMLVKGWAVLLAEKPPKTGLARGASAHLSCHDWRPGGLNRSCSVS